MDKGRDGTRTRKPVSRKRRRKHAVSSNQKRPITSNIGKLVRPAERIHRYEITPLRTSEQLLDHRSRSQRGNRATAVIEEVDMRIDAQHLEHRVMNVGRSNRPVLRDFSQTVG